MPCGRLQFMPRRRVDPASSATLGQIRRSIKLKRLGKYEIIRELGRGAMGVVFKARDPRIGRLVALKTITAGLADDPDLLQRFYREAQAAGSLQHPNVVTVYEMGEEGGAPFIAMEYLEGESLEQLIARRPALRLAQRVGYLVQACRAQIGRASCRERL